MGLGAPEQRVGGTAVTQHLQNSGQAGQPDPAGRGGRLDSSQPRGLQAQRSSHRPLPPPRPQFPQGSVQEPTHKARCSPSVVQLRCEPRPSSSVSSCPSGAGCSALYKPCQHSEISRLIGCSSGRRPLALLQITHTNSFGVVLGNGKPGGDGEASKGFDVTLAQSHYRHLIIHY